MTVLLTGRDLGLSQVVEVARGGERVALADSARRRMIKAHELAQRVFESGAPTYGLTTGYGAQKRVAVTPEDVSAFNRSQIQDHRAGQGPPATDDVVRAAMLCLANLFAGGTTVVRPALADALIDALNTDRHPIVRLHGSIGVSDLSAMADLAHGVIGDLALHAGEGLALLNNSAFGTALAALALRDATCLLDAADVAGALALEGFGANLSVLHPGIEKTRPHPGFAATVARARRLLEGSYLWEDGAARNLQDPLTFRSTFAVQAVGREALDHALGILAIELDAAQGNPLVDVADGSIVSVASYESLPLAVALDYVRIALASVLTAASERSVKLLDTPWSGLSTGLSASAGRPDLGLSIHAITAQSLAAEASLLAQPVSFTVVSTSGAEGIEDRATLLPLSARRLAAMVDLGEGVVAIEALVAVQATDLRGRDPLGRGTAAAHVLIRERIPFRREDRGALADPGLLRGLVHTGALGDPEAARSR
jgi:histidine ammonia-lyase